MEEQRFDQFAQAVARGFSRRRAGRFLAGFAIAFAPLAPATLGKRKKKKKCKKGTVRCGKACVDLASDPNHCGGCGQGCSGQACANGVCQSRLDTREV